MCYGGAWPEGMKIKPGCQNATDDGDTNDTIMMHGAECAGRLNKRMNNHQHLPTRGFGDIMERFTHEKHTRSYLSFMRRYEKVVTTTYHV